MSKIPFKKQRRFYNNRAPSKRGMTLLIGRFLKNTTLGGTLGFAVGGVVGLAWLFSVAHVDPVVTNQSKDKPLSEALKKSGHIITSPVNNEQSISLSRNDVKMALTAFAPNLDDVLLLNAEIKVNGNDTTYVFSPEALDKIDRQFNAFKPN